VDLAEREAVEKACQGMDLIINTAHHPALHLERAVLREGGALLDLIELSTPERRRLEDEIAQPAGLVVLHTGLGGIAYLAIAGLLRANPDADAAEYALTVSATGSSGSAGGHFAHRALTGLSHHATAPIPFPEPFGRRRCLEVGGDFEGVLRTVVADTPVRHYMYLHPPAVNALMRGLNFARLIKALPGSFFTGGRRRRSNDLSDEPVREWVAVSRLGRRAASRVVEGRGYYAMTAAATLVFARELTGGHRQAGVRSIEEVFTLAELAPALKRAGIVVGEQADVAAR
jgi:hypothetical protein